MGFYYFIITWIVRMDIKQKGKKMIARFVVMFCLVLNIRPVMANDVLTLKTSIHSLKNLNLDTNNTGRTTENDEQKQLRISFYNTIHKICIDNSKQKVQRTQPLTVDVLDMLEKVCDCYTLTLMDKVDWAKLKQTKSEQIDAYLTTFDSETREECKAKLADRYNNQIPDYNNAQPTISTTAPEVIAGRILAGIIFSILCVLIGLGLHRILRKDQ